MDSTPLSAHISSTKYKRIYDLQSTAQEAGSGGKTEEKLEGKVKEVPTEWRLPVRPQSRHK